MLWVRVWIFRLFLAVGLASPFISFFFLSQKFYPQTVEVMEFTRYRFGTLTFIFQRLLDKNQQNPGVATKGFIGWKIGNKINKSYNL